MLNNESRYLSHEHVNSATTLTVSGNCVMNTVEIPSNSPHMKTHLTLSISSENEFMDIISGKTAEEVVDMLFKAVNNRTRERNYFQLYCNLLDGSITEREFDETIANREDDYIIDESESPSVNKVSLALSLSRKIKDVNSITDLSSLFSFNPNSLENLVLKELV